MPLADAKTHVAQKALIVRDDGKILTMRRSATAPHRPGEWDLPGGRLELGEETREGIIREIKEETGLDVFDLRVHDAISGIASNDERFWLTICYIAKPVTQDVRISHEHTEFQWVTGEELRDMLGSPRGKKFVERFMLAHQK